MKNLNLTYQEQAELESLEFDLAEAKKELANAKRRHKRQQSKMWSDHDSDLSFIKRYTEAGLNELRELTDTGERCVAYDSVRRVTIAHKRAVDTIQKYQAKEYMAKILADGDVERGIKQDIEQIKEKINQLQKEVA